MKRRLQINIHGAVQGVGFRPFIYRLANQLQLTGYVQNNNSGVFVEAEGENSSLIDFLLRIRTEKPQNSIINSFEYSFHDYIGLPAFKIKFSKTSDKTTTALMLPDIALCDECLIEMNDANNRRYLYPFINCTNCGPRYTIIKALPYDRKNTSMKVFDMCEDCRREYENPLDRRFHAQPIACPKCGPHVELWDSNGEVISSHLNAVTCASNLLKEGKIVAIKGLGGFQLTANALSDETVRSLRRRKVRDEKPFALMLQNSESVKQVCVLSKLEEKLLTSPESPIILLERKEKGVDNSGLMHISEYAAPENPYLGIMLPYTPLHHLIMQITGIPLIATSGNLSEEPMCIDEYEALERLRGIADYFLVHDRPIVRYIDDSVVRIINDRIMIIRRARGYAPLPYIIEEQVDNRPVILSVGGQLKNSITMKVDSNAFISQHIGDLTNKEATEGFQNVIRDFENIYHAKPDLTVCDLHPDYLSTKFAETSFSNLLHVQHHVAHIASCRMENQVYGTALGVAWDGTGYGPDGTIWGGEFFLTNGTNYEHFAQIRQFKLPGGEQAIRDIRRTALGILYEIYGSKLWKKKLKLFEHFSAEEINIFTKMLERSLNCVKTSSMGRLFDAVSALTETKLRPSFEGQAAMMLEFIADLEEKQSYKFEIQKEDKLIIDWQSLFEQLLDDIYSGISRQNVSAKFHNTLADIVNSVALSSGQKKVILSGGCFQNALLLRKTIAVLQVNGFEPYWHHRIPTNDGGISFGQLSYALNKISI